MIPITQNAIDTGFYGYCKYNDSINIVNGGVQLCCMTDFFNKSLYNKISIDFDVDEIKRLTNNIQHICNFHNCANYKPIDYTPQYTQIALNNWSKCVSHCVSCYNYIQDFSNERVYTEEELDKFLTTVGELYKYLIERNRIVIEKSEIDMEPVIPTLTITGSGDCFYSENYHNILKTDLTKYGIKRIKIITNLQTFTNHNLNSIHPNTKKLIDTIMFSVDGTDKETYEKIRFGSKWDNLFRGYENMIAHFPNLKECQANVVLSKWNYHSYKYFPKFIYDNFPAVNKLSLAFVSKWYENSIYDELLLDEEQRAEITEWFNNTKFKTNVTLL